MTNSTVRIYQLANELNLSSKDILQICHDAQLSVTAATSSLSQAQADSIRARIKGPSLLDKPVNLSVDLSVDLEEGSAIRNSSTISPVLYSAQYYFNRELSWLKFNERVLHEAFDPRNPLLERLKFMAIFSNNLDEYFMVRISGLQQQVAAQVMKRTQDGMMPQEQLDAIHGELKPLVTRQHRYFCHDLTFQLDKAGIHVLTYEDLTEQQIDELQTYFLEQVFPVLTPLAVDPGHPFPYISSLSLSLAVVIKDRETGEEHFARVKVPDRLPRFIPLTQCREEGSRWCGVPIEQVIAHNAYKLFPGMDVKACHPFRITRNADFEIEEDEADDLLIAIEQELRKRRFGFVVRMEVQTGMPSDLQQTLMSEMGLKDQDVYTVEGLICLNDLFAISSLPLPELKEKSWSPVIPAEWKKLAPLLSLDENGKISDRPSEEGGPSDIFSLIRAQDLLVHHPYESFTATVQRFIAEAAYDPDVLTIKMTLYRTAGDSRDAAASPIVNSLIAAAENGKQVVVLVELKARFDEENNILWARKLEKVGVHVVYGLIGLKTHTKVVLVVRREDQKLRRYVHIGTGNYNPKTARLYTDLGLFSCRDDLGADLTDLFNYLTGYAKQLSYRKILIAPVNLRDRMIELVRREAELQRRGKKGRIIIKMNSLIDPDLIAALYSASQAGVQIDAVVRGICALKPAITGISDNIRVISIIGRFLEHERVFYFHNNGHPKVFIGSADWRPRNLERRVEAVVPIEDPALVIQMQEILDLYLADNRHAWDLQPDGQYIQRRPASGEPEQSSHRLLMKAALRHSQS
jgi:polyphosphate kinase